MNPRQIFRLAFFAILLPAWLAACDGPSDSGDDRLRVGIDGNQTKKDSSPLVQAVDQIWTDASVGTDSKYGQYFKKSARDSASAPADMRELISNWNGSNSLRRWPDELGFSCVDKRIRFTWTAEIANSSQPREALDQFDSAMKKHGYRILDDLKSIQKFCDRLGLSAAEIDRWAYTEQYHAYTRTVGDTEIAVFAESIDYTGGSRNQSGVNIQWILSRSFPHGPPTFGEALDALPNWFRASYLDKTFYQALASEKISVCSAGRGTSVEFNADVYDKLVKALEGHGFEYRDEKEPHPRGGFQKTWYRFTDVTYAHVITYADSKRTRFSCQAPQNTGPPNTKKPPPLHPSLRLPRSKRPVLELKDLAFADPKLRQQAEYFHALAESIAEEGWFVQRYKDVRNSPDPLYLATWQTTEVRSNYYLKKVLPYRSMSITLHGRRATEGKEKISTMEFSGRWVPRTGWAAAVNHNLHPGVAGSWALAQIVQEQNSQISFDGLSSSNLIRLTRAVVKANVREKNSDLSYGYQVQLPYGQTPEGTAALRDRFFALFESPERLRDLIVGDIRELRRIARDEIDKSKGIKVTNWRNVRSDNPPREEPHPGISIPESVKKKLLEQILSKLESIEATVQDDHKQIHAALKKALPIDRAKMAIE